MKFLAITLLAVCLIQGNNAQFGGSLTRLAGNLVGAGRAAGLVGNIDENSANPASDLVNNVADNAAKAARNIVNNVVDNAASNVVSNVVSNVASNVVSNVAQTVTDAASNVGSQLSDAASSALASIGSLDLDQITSLIGDLDEEDLLQTIVGAVDVVTSQVGSVQGPLENAIASALENANTTIESVVEASTGVLSSQVQNLVARAAELGVDVRECGAGSVDSIIEGATTDAVTCVTDQIDEATTLATNIANVPIQAATLAKEGVVAYNTCASRTSSSAKNLCKATKVAPVSLQALVLAKNTATYLTKATTLIPTLEVELTACATKVVVNNAIKVAQTGVSVASCVADKLKN